MERYQIGIIGAGISGICAAIQLQKKFGDKIAFTLFEKNSDVGGNWLKNVYPGNNTLQHHDVRVIHPVTCTAFRLNKNPNWSTNYASQPEILDYLRRLTRKYKISEQIKFQHEVKMVCWNEDLSKWMVRYVDVSIPNAVEETRTFDIIINAPGALRVPLIPNEFSAFTGPTMHTAEWNHEIDLKDKKVAVVGSGASAIQVIPSIVDSVGALHCYQRKPPYIVPRPQFTIPNFMKAIFKFLPFVMWLYRCAIYVFYEFFYSAFRPDSILHWLGRTGTTAYRQHELKKHRHLWDDVTPRYSFGCKRVLVSEQYYAAIARPNVHLHLNQIEKIVDRTIYTTDGTKEEVDVLILATGFRVSDFFSPMEVIGKGGKNILRSWIDDRPRNFYGVVFSDTPNYFYVFGPNTALGHSSVVFMIECQVNFITDAINEMMKTNAKVLDLKRSAEVEFMEKLDVEMKNTIWGRERCDSYYGNPRGNVIILWPNNSISYWWQTKNIDWSKFDFM